MILQLKGGGTLSFHFIGHFANRPSRASTSVSGSVSFFHLLLAIDSLLHQNKLVNFVVEFANGG